MGSSVQVEGLALDRTMDHLSIVTENEKSGRGVEGLNREKEPYQNLDIQTCFFDMVTIKISVYSSAQKKLSLEAMAYCY